MDAFEALRRQAQTRRDEKIKEARRKCQETIRWVDQLERQLVPPPPTKPERKRCGLMPTDREFQMVEHYERAKRAMPKRRLSQNMVRSSLAYLEENDRVRPTRLINAPIQWASPAYVTKVKQWVQPTCAKVAEQVLRAKGPMRLLDLVVAVREAGFRADDDPRKVQRALAKSLYTNRQFKISGKVWGLV